MASLSLVVEPLGSTTAALTTAGFKKI